MQRSNGTPIQAHASEFNSTLSTLFADDPSRAKRYVIEAAGLRFDYSKHWIDDATRALLLDQLHARDFIAKRNAFFSGEKINLSERRAVLHMALRAAPDDIFAVDGESVMPDVLAARARCFAFAENVRSGELKGATGQMFTDVVNIGIGGSDLGPLMVSEALKPWVDGPQPHYVSNVDGAHLADVLSTLNPETTLILVASKTFTTAETLHNANKARQWIVAQLGESAVGAHFAALSTHADAVQRFGIGAERMFPFWDWVGGRFSVWSSIGLSLMIALGADDFSAFLDGARAMDRHFLDAPLEQNIPVLMGMLGVWYRNGFDLQTHAVVPYAQRLAYLPAFLQQLEMESNGKSVQADGSALEQHSSPVVWGQTGTNGQHAFFQLLHQGTLIAPMDFIVAAEAVDTDQTSQQILLANCLAQAEALAFGRSDAAVKDEMLSAGLSDAEIAHRSPHRQFPGNRPSSLIMARQWTPRTLGALIAAYEHKVFTQGVYWGVNAFDQWGVELGKTRADALIPMLASGAVTEFSESTVEAVAWLKAQSR